VRPFMLGNDGSNSATRTFGKMTGSNEYFALKRTDDVTSLIAQFGAYVNHAFFARRNGTHANHARGGADGVTGKTCVGKTNGEVREVRDGLFADVMHTERQTQVEQNERVDGSIWEAKIRRDTLAGMRRNCVLEGSSEEGEHSFVDRDFPGVFIDGSGNEVVVVPAVTDCVEHSNRRWRRGNVGGASMTQPALSW
jgi:hypothetical protein